MSFNPIINELTKKKKKKEQTLTLSVLGGFTADAEKMKISHYEKSSVTTFKEAKYIHLV